MLCARACQPSRAPSSLTCMGVHVPTDPHHTLLPWGRRQRASSRSATPDLNVMRGDEAARTAPVAPAAALVAAGALACVVGARAWHSCAVDGRWPGSCSRRGEAKYGSRAVCMHRANKGHGGAPTPVPTPAQAEHEQRPVAGAWRGRTIRTLARHSCMMLSILGAAGARGSNGSCVCGGKQSVDWGQFDFGWPSARVPHGVHVWWA